MLSLRTPKIPNRGIIIQLGNTVCSQRAKRPADKNYTTKNLYSNTRAHMHDLIPQSNDLERLEARAGSQAVYDIARLSRQPLIDTPESISW